MLALILLSLGAVVLTGLWWSGQKESWEARPHGIAGGKVKGLRLGFRGGARMPMTLNAEGVAYWYLRLNGFLCLRNFLVHGDTGGEVRTEIDVVGVRFKHRREHFRDPMIDDDWIEQAKRTIVVFCDAKTGARDINLPWQNRERKQWKASWRSWVSFQGRSGTELQASSMRTA